MIKNSKIKLTIFTCFLFLFVIPAPVEAYLDPSTGSYLFQFLIAGLLGGVFFMKGYIFKIKDFFQKGSKKSPKNSTENEK